MCQALFSFHSRLLNVFSRELVLQAIGVLKRRVLKLKRNRRLLTSFALTARNEFWIHIFILYDVIALHSGHGGGVLRNDIILREWFVLLALFGRASCRLIVLTFLAIHTVVFSRIIRRVDFLFFAHLHLF